MKKDESKLDAEVNDEKNSSKNIGNTIYSRKSKAPSASSSGVNKHAVVRKESSKEDNTIINEATSSKKTIYSRKAKTLLNESSLNLDDTVFSESTINKKTSYVRRVKTISTAGSSKSDNTVIDETATSRKTIYSKQAKSLANTDSDVYKDAVKKTKKLVIIFKLNHLQLLDLYICFAL